MLPKVLVVFGLLTIAALVTTSGASVPIRTFDRT